MTKLQVSQDIDSFCLKCDLLLAHVIMSLKGDRPHRVKCKSCKDVHAYRVAKPKSRQAGTAKPRKTAAKKPARATEYQRLLEGRDTSGAKPYSMTGSFGTDEIIDHAKFGIGLVIKQARPGRIEVLFAEGTKLMVCG
ncbi:MAG: hypothetical protein GY906_14585 [bacterium]|nr:hypothetical protein [bacterium]